MEIAWLVAAIALGQAACIAGVVAYARARPTSRFPFFARPESQPVRSRVLLAVGVTLTVFATLMLARGLFDDWRVALVIAVSLLPMFLGIAVVNARASTRRAAASDGAA